MRQFKQTKPAEEKQVTKPIVTEAVDVTLRNIDAVARELTVDGTRVVLVNVEFVLAMERRIKALETQLTNIKGQQMFILQKVKSIK
jgi:hypothetical protein